MRLVVIAAMAVLAFNTIQSAGAVDMSAPALQPVTSPPPPPVWSWTGIYDGVNGAGGWSHHRVSGTQTVSDGTASTFGGTANNSGGLVGGQFGINTDTVGGVELGRFPTGNCLLRLA
jgi:outer membrane immunogenic protein